jgi:hypothetical protein
MWIYRNDVCRDLFWHMYCVSGEILKGIKSLFSSANAVICKILHSDMHMFLYKITVRHKLANTCHIMPLGQDMKSVLHNMWFSDDPHFHLDGVVSKQNV